MKWKDQIKYFLHGALFSLLFVNLQIPWNLIMASVVLLPASISGLVGVVILILTIGGLNALVAGGLDAIVPQRLQEIVWPSLQRILQWRLWFTMKRSILRVLVQGFILAAILITTDFLFYILPGILRVDPLILFILLIIVSYLDGRVCKSTAGAFRGIED